MIRQLTNGDINENQKSIWNWFIYQSIWAQSPAHPVHVLKHPQAKY